MIVDQLLMACEVCDTSIHIMYSVVGYGTVGMLLVRVHTGSNPIVTLLLATLSGYVYRKRHVFLSDFLTIRRCIIIVAANSVNTSVVLRQCFVVCIRIQVRFCPDTNWFVAAGSTCGVVILLH